MPVAIFDSDFHKANEILSTVGLPALQHVIAKTIAEERERCAVIAENFKDRGAGVVSQQIADNIRAR